MFFYLVLLFTALPAAELIILIRLGQTFGLFNTFALIIGTGVLGAYVARLQGFVVFNRIQTQINQGIMPTEDMIDGVMILAGGITLLTPGLITDIIGFLLILGPTRALIKAFIKKRFQGVVQDRSGIITVTASERPGSEPEDLDEPFKNPQK